MKAALRSCHEPLNWTLNLPLVLLGLRCCYRQDLKASNSELVYGTTLRLPHDFVDNTKQEPCLDPSEFTDRLKLLMRSIRYASPRIPNHQPIFMSPDLEHATHVYVRRDATGHSLLSRYMGPFKVLDRKDKVFTVETESGSDTISIDRIKPAFIEPQQINFIQSTVLTSESSASQNKPSTRNLKRIQFNETVSLQEYRSECSPASSLKGGTVAMPLS